MLVEQISAEIDTIAHLAAQQIADRPAKRLASKIQAGHLDRAKGTRRRLELALPQRRAQIAAPARATRPDRRLKRCQLERIAPDHQITHRQQVIRHRLATVGLADAGGAVIADDLDDCAQGVGRVQAHGGAQRRVAKRDRGDAVIDDFHYSSVIGVKG
jgi:hypothetical protein